MNKYELKDKINKFLEDFDILSKKHNLQIVFLNDERIHVFLRNQKYYLNEFENMKEEIMETFEKDYNDNYFDEVIDK